MSKTHSSVKSEITVSTLATVTGWRWSAPSALASSASETFRPDERDRAAEHDGREVGRATAAQTLRLRLTWRPPSTRCLIEA
jgi:hypothetical protein